MKCWARSPDWASIWQCGSKEARSRTNNAIKAAIEQELRAAKDP